MANVRVPKPDRHKSGEARVQYGGKSYYLGPHGSREAEEKYRLFVAELLAGRPPSASAAHVTTVSVNEAGVPEWAPNQLRHNAATIIRSRYGLEAAQTVLGHRNAKVTEIYAERDAAKAREVSEGIG